LGTFDINPIQNNLKQLFIVTPLIDKRIVKSSSGFRNNAIIQTFKIGDAIWPIEMTLTNRDSMGFRMLLGRKMSGRVLVDPAQQYFWVNQ
jgi:ribosomal protein S6--L-glutamate ligase